MNTEDVQRLEVGIEVCQSFKQSCFLHENHFIQGGQEYELSFDKYATKTKSRGPRELQIILAVLFLWTPSQKMTIRHSYQMTLTLNILYMNR